jgi:hypothetical protein
MECDKCPGDGLPPHTDRSEKDSRRSSEGGNSERKILTDTTRRDSDPSTYGKQVRSLLHRGTQTYDLQKNLKFFQAGSPKEFEVLPSTRG